MDRDYLMEKSSALRNEMSHIWGGAFVIGGGISTIVLTLNWNLVKILFCLIGFLFIIIFLNAYMIKRMDLVNTINKLKEGKNG